MSEPLKDRVLEIIEDTVDLHTPRFAAESMADRIIAAVQGNEVVEERKWFLYNTNESRFVECSEEEQSNWPKWSNGNSVTAHQCPDGLWQFDVKLGGAFGRDIAALVDLVRRGQGAFRLGIGDNVLALKSALPGESEHYVVGYVLIPEGKTIEEASAEAQELADKLRGGGGDQDTKLLNALVERGYTLLDPPTEVLVRE